MSRDIVCENVVFDVDKAFYDLALLYAQEKLRHSLDHNLISDEHCPLEIAEMEYLMDTFYDALGYISNVKVDALPSRIDRLP